MILAVLGRVMTAVSTCAEAGRTAEKRMGTVENH